MDSFSPTVDQIPQNMNKALHEKIEISTHLATKLANAGVIESQADNEIWCKSSCVHCAAAPRRTTAQLRSLMTVFRLACYSCLLLAGTFLNNAKSLCKVSCRLVCALGRVPSVLLLSGLLIAAYAN